jgi:hypothetical protein
MNLMSYDYHGGWDPITVTTLRGVDQRTLHRIASDSVDAYLNGFPAQKLYWVCPSTDAAGNVSATANGLYRSGVNASWAHGKEFLITPTSRTAPTNHDSC